MRRTFLVLSLFGILIIVAFTCLSNSARADIPKRINFQGVLKDTLGNPVPDGNYSLTFRIYDAASGGNLLWQEADVFAISGGLVTHLLGSIIPIPESVFQDSLRWVGVQVGSNPEISPRSQLVSTPYAYVADFAQNADKLDGLNSTDFLNTASDFGRSGVATDLYEGAGTLSSKYVNVSGPDSVVSTSGTAFLGKASGGSASSMFGLRGIADNTSTGFAYGSFGYANNTSTGTAYGGFFTATASGTGTHYGVYGSGSGSSSAPTYGSYGYADNTSTGDAYGGYFSTSASGIAGYHYGVYGSGSGSSSAPTYGSYGYADNTSTGNAYGGFFSATAFGTGIHYGVVGVEASGGGGAAVYASGDFAGSGAKYAVAKTSQGHRLLSVIESPEVWFEDFGEGQLVNGQAHIELDPLFLETVTINASNPIKVFIQLKDDCKGVYVKPQNTGFDVFELQSGTSNAAFSYRLVAKRKGYETQRLKATDVGMDDPNLYPELWEKIEKEQQHRQAEVSQAALESKQ